RQRLEVVFLRLRVALADADEILGGRLRLGGVDARALAARAARHQQLWPRGRAARIVAAHPNEHLLPFLGVVVRREDALQRVAARAVGEERLLLVRAGDAGEPFAVGELRGEIPRLVELEIGLGPARGDLDRLRPIEDIAGGPDRDRVLARLDAIARE